MWNNGAKANWVMGCLELQVTGVLNIRKGDIRDIFLEA